MIINDGATLTSTGGAVYVGKVASGTLSVDGGTLTADDQIVLGAGSSSNNTSSMTIENGGSVSASMLAFGGSNGTNNLSVSILSGSDLTVGTVNASGTYASASIAVDGGNFTLTADDATTSFGLTPASTFGVTYESGSIVWSGVTDTTEFGNFQTVFNSVVDDPSGFFSSATYSDAQLKSVLTYQAGTGAVLAVPEPSTFALLSGFIALGAIMLRRRK